jgi:hypothetical protein
MRITAIAPSMLRPTYAVSSAPQGTFGATTPMTRLVAPAATETQRSGRGGVRQLSRIARGVVLAPLLLLAGCGENVAKMVESSVTKPANGAEISLVRYSDAPNGLGLSVIQPFLTEQASLPPNAGTQCAYKPTPGFENSPWWMALVAREFETGAASKCLYEWRGEELGRPVTSVTELLDKKIPTKIPGFATAVDQVQKASSHGGGVASGGALSSSEIVRKGTFLCNLFSGISEQKIKDGCELLRTNPSAAIAKAESYLNRQRGPNTPPRYISGYEAVRGANSLIDQLTTQGQQQGVVDASRQLMAGNPTTTAPDLFFGGMNTVKGASTLPAAVDSFAGTPRSATPSGGSFLNRVISQTILDAILGNPPPTETF